MARKILLADDSVTAQNMGRKILADAGYEVITVNNGSAALKKIAEHKPDLIILDVYMPGYSGLEVCQRLKEAQETSRTPVLLTVGKLEPFKPEEAKRARADAFIVKPFEASELLSALAKLEDRIVPRAESSKPGRFARAIAAVEEGTGKTEADGEDSGWKNRIAFPSKKKAKDKEKTEEEAEDPANYNPVNRDLRTVMDQHEPRKEYKADSELSVNPPSAVDEPRVDVTAVASMGLPKDVTPEEIAALAAAVAQVQAKVSAAQNASGFAVSENPASPASVGEAQPAKVEETKPREVEVAKAAENLESKAAPEVKPADQEPHHASFAEAATIDIASPEVLRAEIARAEAVRAEAASKKAIEAANQTASSQSASNQPAANHADVIAAIASLEPADGKSWDPQTPGNGSGPATHQHSSSAAAEDVPVTMAAAAGVGGSGSRWSAVPVAVDRDEAALSLELEMQKAYAAFAAAEGNAPGFVTTAGVETQAQPIASSSPVAELVAAPSPEPELSEASIPTVPISSAAVYAAVTEFQRVASSHVEAAAVPAPPVEPVANVQVESEAVAQNEVQTSAPSEVIMQSAPQVSESTVTQTFESPVASSFPQEETISEPEAEIAKIAEAEKVEKEETKTEEFKKEELPAQPVEPVIATANLEASSAHVSLAQPQTEPATEAAPAVAETAVASSNPAGGAVGMGDRESVAAAAWASWRQIRESGDKGKSTSSSKANKNEDDDEDEAPAPSTQPAAMAAAAGAEKSPEEAQGEAAADPDSIASIVDSVLADLRPKIVAEISRKLGEKK